MFLFSTYLITELIMLTFKLGLLIIVVIWVGFLAALFHYAPITLSSIQRYHDMEIEGIHISVIARV